MEKSNLPIYRAKKMNSDENVIGSLVGNFIIVKSTIIKGLSIFRIDEAYEIDITTLAVHFPNNNMLDSEETPIFASLDKEKGRGGDICTYNYLLCKYTMIFNPIIGVKAINLLDYDDNGYILNPRLTVIGIQK